MGEGESQRKECVREKGIGGKRLKRGRNGMEREKDGKRQGKGALGVNRKREGRMKCKIKGEGGRERGRGRKREGGRESVREGENMGYSHTTGGGVFMFIKHTDQTNPYIVRAGR